MTPSELSSIIKPVSSHVGNPYVNMSLLLTDSRKMTEAEQTLFFAIPTKRNNGSLYVEELYNKGVRSFVVPAEVDSRLAALFERMDDANFWYVKDVIGALQHVAANRRSQFDIPVVGITGSNGKTIVKDWIVQLLASDRHVVSNPKSYNSQIGVPLSVWQMDDSHDFAVFEAGISEAGEMESLRNIIQPTIGIFTNIGQAHDENFLSRGHKIAEKLQLFTHCQTLIYCADHKDIYNAVYEKEIFHDVRHLTWGSADSNPIQLLGTHIGDHGTAIAIRLNPDGVFSFDDVSFQVTIPFVDRASVENAMHCVALMLLLGYQPSEVAERCRHLMPVAMRMEMDEGINNCLLINDSYSLDINSLHIALDFLQQERQHFHKTLIISDFVQSGIHEDELYSQVAAVVAQRGITKLIGIGPALSRNAAIFSAIAKSHFFLTTEQFLNEYSMSDFQNETILLKGARRFSFENIAKVLQRKRHETVMEVSLDALVHNANYYRSLIKPSTKLMAMVKASSYGAGNVEVANTLQFSHVDYLTVAYADEGVELRRNGITLPIMVMNPEEDCFDNIIRYSLEPDIYSFRILELFADASRAYTNGDRKVAIHIEVDTGMHRLGFAPSQIDQLVEKLASVGSHLAVRSVFSHLACSEDPAMDDFTLTQINLFRDASTRLKSLLNDQSILCHILNSSGIVRFPQAQMDMVRLGIGLYGIAPQPDVQQKLMPVSTLKTRISQIKVIPSGDSVGYNRRFMAQRDTTIAIIPIGYADGLSRHLGYGNGSVAVGGKMAPIIGSVCMDMCFVDVTGIQCSEGDEVIIFGPADQLCTLADAAGTIPYEILTSVSPRVKRVYISE